MNISNVNFYFLLAGFLLGVYVILMYGLHQEAGWQSSLSNTQWVEEDVVEHTKRGNSRPRSAAARRIIILSLHRSGSSFTGELVGRHPGVFYVYEPFQLYPFGLPHKQGHVDRVAEAFLRPLLQCRFTPLITDVRQFHKDAAQRISRFGPRSFCQPFNKKPKGHTAGVGSAQRPGELDCGKLNFTQIRSACEERPVVATKLVTVTNFSSIVALAKEGVKVVHLVRDPRGQLQSIHRIGNSLDMYSKLTVTQRARNICKVLKEGLQMSTSLIRSDREFRTNYRRLRFEDLVGQPRRYSGRLNQFTGLGEDPSVTAWVRAATMEQTQGGKPVLKSYLKVWAWRRSISFDHNFIIESICKGVLNDLGYIETQSEQHLRNLNKTLHGVPKINTGWL